MVLFRTTYIPRKNCLNDLSCKSKNPRAGPEVIKLNSVGHEILNAHKYIHIKKLGVLGSDQPRMLFFPLKNVKCQQLLAF